jgi:hypothetical protein
MKMTQVQSSAILAIGYDAQTLQMCIEFKRGKTYTYCDVPKNVFDRFIFSESKGRFYDLFIKDKYNC